MRVPPHAMTESPRETSAYRCPACASQFGRGADVCPNDGTRLAPPDLEPGALVAGRFRVAERLGPDAAAGAYLARAAETGAGVVLRVFGPGAAPDAEASRRFRQGAAALAALGHPNMARVVDYGVNPVVGPFLATELPEGVTLADWLARFGPLKPGEAAAVVRSACYAVQAAHDAGVPHGALTTHSVFVELAERGPSARVEGFGVASLAAGARLGAAGDTAPTDTTPGGRTVFEAEAPMQPAPETPGPQPREDVEALGRLLFEAAAGAAPEDSAGASWVEQALSAVCPPWLVSAAAWALASDPSARFRTPAELARALRPPAPGESGFGWAAASTGTLETAAPAVVYRTNLPQPITSFVGREGQISGVGARLAESRLVTLAGPGGIGKTRLGLAVAGSLRFRFADGVWFVELGPLGDPELVPLATAEALGLREEPAVPMADTLLAALRHRELLLVLDNCEHVAGAAAALVDRVLKACPRVRVLATSRETLGVPGEALWEVPSLSLPGRGGAGEGESEAVRLFVERARAGAPRFEITERNAAAVAELCRRLEGLPLALELAAARVRMLPPEQLLERLSDRFRLLTGGGRTRPRRQQTLLSAVEWSYDLLDEGERAVFQRLSVFAGGCTLEAAEAVCAVPGAGGVLDLLASLVDKSLLRAEEQDGESRYRMLETIREYAAGRLQASPDLGATTGRFLAWAVASAEAGHAGLFGPDAGRWVGRLRAEHDNFRAALDRMCEAGDAASALRLTAALYLFWNLGGYLREGRTQFERALALGGDVPPLVRGRALLGYGVLLEQQGDADPAREALLAAVGIFRAVPSPEDLSFALHRLGASYANLGRPGEALEALSESYEIARAGGDRMGIANALFGLGVAAIANGDYAEASAKYGAALEIYRECGHKQRTATALHNLGNALESEGRLEEAEALLTQSVEIGQELGYVPLIALSRSSLAEVALGRGDVRRAFTLYAEALATLADVGYRRGIAFALEGCACAAAAAGDAWAALRLAGAAASLREVLETAINEDERRTLDERLAPAREALGDEFAARELEAGRAMGLDRAVAYARERAASLGRG